MKLRDYLKAIVHGGTLSRAEATECCELLLADGANQNEVGALLCALHARGETVQELTGFLATMRAQMTRVSSADAFAVDLCGTGGDGSHSFNVSTSAALLTAACGATVAKHGNRAISSQSGSADFLESLRIPFCTNADDAELALKTNHFAFLFAPHFHPAMKSVAPIRKELGVRTIFNLLGPLANPACVKRQLIGVFDPKWMRPIVETLAQSGSEYVIVVHGANGMDEVTLDGPTRFCMLRENSISDGIWDVREWGVNDISHDVVLGGTGDHNAQRLLAVANGNERELGEWIIANCAPALVLSGIADNFVNAVALARDCVTSGAFAKFIETLRTE